MNIYIDIPRTILATKQLYENQTYYIDFEDADKSLILESIKHSKLEQFIVWQQGNRYATLKITNYIGNIYFFGKTYDVRSKKFLLSLSGAEQVEVFINDIQNLSKNVIYTYRSPSFAVRQTNYEDMNPTLLMVFNYFKNIIIDWGKHTNLESNFQRIISDPNFKYSTLYEVDRVEKVKRIDVKTLKVLASAQKHIVKLDKEQKHLINLPVVKFLSRGGKGYYFPEKILIKKKVLNFDTAENRFLKFFLQYIEGVAYSLRNIKNLPQSFFEEREQILSFCRTTLNNPFFKHVGNISFVPSHSTILQSRSGYKDVFDHYTRSRFGVRHFFEDFKREQLSIDLKRISDLYEYWVFYKIAVAVLGSNIIMESQEAVIKNGDISYGISFKNDFATVYYNYTASRSRKSAYSVTLRPDITVAITKGGKNLKFIFDAKYKVKRNNNENGLEGFINPEDIYKMHTYVDAIKDTVFAIAVYPGTEFYFYERNGIEENIRKDIASIKCFEGVGAIPLVPEDKMIDDQFNSFIEKVKEMFL